MQDTKEFTEFLLAQKALKFGDFTLKSGRKSPFFVNIGEINSGDGLCALANYYADTIAENFDLQDGDVLFGPAYKAIPLVATTAVALSMRHDINVRYCTNRKEVKDHGDGGKLLGAKLTSGDRVLILEDVTTSGRSLAETVPIIREAGAIKLLGLVVSVDRCERGEGEQTALHEMGEKYGFDTAAITSMMEIYQQANDLGILTPELREAIHNYYEEYGAVGVKLPDLD